MKRCVLVVILALLIPASAVAEVDCDAFRKVVDQAVKSIASESAAGLAATKPKLTPLEEQIAGFYKPGVTIGAAGYLMIAAQALIDASAAEGGAARAQLRELRISNYLRIIEINLNIMVQGKCPLPREPISLDLAAQGTKP